MAGLFLACTGLAVAGFVSFALCVLASIAFDGGNDRWAAHSCVAAGLGVIGMAVTGLLWLGEVIAAAA